MAKHEPTIVPTDDGRWIGACTCRWRAPDVCDTAQAAEDANLKHMRDVDRVRANSRKVPPTLRESRDYFRKRADDPKTPPETAKLWAQLANEIDRRLNDATPANSGQDALW